MNEAVVPTVWCGEIFNQADWVEVMYDAGMECRFGARKAEHDTAVIDCHPAGAMNIGTVELSRLRLSPASCRAMQRDDILFLKVVQSGELVVEQQGRVWRFDAGSMLLIDPAHGFKDYIDDTTRVAILQIPRSALKDRGLRYSFKEPYIADLSSQDVKAIRSVLLHTALGAAATSEPLRERLCQQFLDLLDVVLHQARTPARGSVHATVVLRTKQVVLRSLADPQLSVNKIAAELHMSPSYLTRTLKALGLSPMRYAWSLRLEQAAALLARAGAEPLQSKEVAFRCGFADAAHFSRAFKARYGMSPREFSLLQASPQPVDAVD